VVSGPQEVTSIRQAAALCNVTPPVVRRWLSLGLICGPPWTVEQLHEVLDMTDPQGRRSGPQAAHGTLTRWLEGCDCDRCREAQKDAARARFRRNAQARLVREAGSRPDGNPPVTTSGMAPMPPTSAAVSAASAGSTSASGWPVGVSTLDVLGPQADSG
jgi:hypothetical protein